MLPTWKTAMTTSHTVSSLWMCDLLTNLGERYFFRVERYHAIFPEAYEVGNLGKRKSVISFTHGQRV
jgi:hypothetical protein